jgi:hypothetical protein
LCYQSKIILGIITLDLFAVLLGGAVTILPMFANDIFHVGAGGLGWLRNAMPRRRGDLHGRSSRTGRRCKKPGAPCSGPSRFSAGDHSVRCGEPELFRQLARAAERAWFWFSFALLALAGAVDNVSVVVRQTLVQILTPDEKRGRVSAVNSLFIGTSNELGGFRSGHRGVSVHGADGAGQRPGDGRDHLHRERRDRDDSGGHRRGVDLAGNPANFKK